MVLKTYTGDIGGEHIFSVEGYIAFKKKKNLKTENLKKPVQKVWMICIARMTSKD